MKIRIVTVLTAILLATALSAGNSVFSYSGTPCQFYGYDIYGISMGEVGLSDVFRKNTGYANPAILGATDKTLFSTGMLFGWTGYKSDDGTEKSYRDNSLDFPYFSIAVPLNNHHLGFQFNSLLSGVVKNQITFDTADSLTVTEQQSIDQYFYRADLIYALHYNKLNFGAGLNYYFGHDNRMFYQDGGFGIFNTSEKLESSYKNPSFSVGMTAQSNNVSTGAYFSAGCELDGETTRTSIHETENLGEVKYSIPAQAGAGVTTKLGGEFKVTGEFVYTFWKDAEYSGYDHDGWKAGLGFAHEPAEGSRRTFFGQINKRAGVSYRELPFYVNGNKVTETAVSAGWTFPVKNSENRLDFGVQYLWRGNLEQHKLQDRALMFMFGITGFDILSKAFNRTAPREIPKVEEITQ